MLQAPAHGLRSSVKQHNCERNVLLDWIEASVLFDDPELSVTDVVDVLMEEQAYETQAFAHEFVEQLWADLESRRQHCGAVYPFEVTNSRIALRTAWSDAVVFAFCLLASARRLYSQREAVTTGAFNDQGRLFEELVAHAFKGLGFSTHALGWSRKSAESIEAKVAALAKAVDESTRENAVKRWLSQHAKDAGTDLAAWLPVQDGRGAKPVLLVQCASGTNWVGKLKQPDLNTWGELIEFSSSPRRAVAIPFALTSDELRRAGRCDGNMLIVDRARLAVSFSKVATTPEAKALAGRLSAWIDPARAQVLKRVA